MKKFAINPWYFPPHIYALHAVLIIILFGLFALVEYFFHLNPLLNAFIMFSLTGLGGYYILKGLYHYTQETSIFPDSNNAKRKAQRREFMASLTSTIDLNRVLELITNIVHEAVRVDDVSILLIDEKKTCFRIMKTVKPIQYNIEIPIIELDPNYKKGQPIKVDVTKIYTHIVPQLEKLGYNFVFPLEHNERLLGTLNLRRDDETLFSAPDVDWLTFITEVAVISIANSMIFQESFEKQRVEMENERLRLVDQKKTELINTVAHELRTPLTAIRSYSEILLEERISLDDEKRKRFLTIVSDESRRLARMITQMLDLARITSGRISMMCETTSVQDLIVKSVGIVQSLADDKNISITMDMPANDICIFVDYDKLQQVMINLLSNAIKYTDHDGHIWVMVEVIWDSEIGQHNQEMEETAEDGLVKVSIRDNGVGLTAEEAVQVFNEFYRVYNKFSREAKGTGLGLSITRSIIEAHNGLIWAEGEPDVGSTFSFIIPLAKTHRATITAFDTTSEIEK